MGTEKKYSVIELGRASRGAEDTINDWLSKYSMYIDFTVQGKRRVYTDSSLAVLKEISGLRNSGMSSVDIEAELAKRHPVRAEPELPEAAPVFFRSAKRWREGFAFFPACGAGPRGKKGK